jgi:peptidyl-tRNA hydrolase, PTH1 family
MKAVIGLGNPGSRYDQTRHNVGFQLIDYLAAGSGVSSFRRRCQADVAEMRENDEVIYLVKPQTFMNLSGQAVRELVDFHKLSISDLIVVCDDAALPLGKLRVRKSGSHGGQNGLRNIQAQLGTEEYPRLKIGIGAPNEFQPLADFVLGKFKPSEKSTVDDAIAEAAQAILLWIRQGIEPCMNQVNGGSKK